MVLAAASKNFEYCAFVISVASMKKGLRATLCCGVSYVNWSITSLRLATSFRMSAGVVPVFGSCPAATST